VNSARILIAKYSTENGELCSALEREGYKVAEVEAAVELIERACSGHYDVLVAAATLDDTPVHGLCRTIRRASELGIIVVGDKVGTAAIDALNAGADDYVTPPFVTAELVARVRAILRRVARPVAKQIVLQDRTIDLKSRKVKGPGSRLSHLTPKEFEVLENLVTHTNRPRTHLSLAQTVWQRDDAGEIEYMRAVIKQLRRKLEPDPDNPRYILTDRSVGYRFQMPCVETSVVSLAS